jgi:hypothetical protein
VIFTGLATLFLVAGLVVTLAVTERGAKAGRESEALTQQDSAEPLVQAPEPAIDPAAAVEPKPDETASAPRASRPQSDHSPSQSLAALDGLFDRASSAPECESYGTAVRFLSRPPDAARQALRESKLLFVLHVSGNFEDAKFT